MSYNNGTAAFQSIFAVDGATAIAAAGPLYAAPSVRGKRDSIPTIKPGVLVITDANKMNSLGAAPSASTHPKIRFAVGISIGNTGMTDYYRFSAPIASTALQAYDSSEAVCGQNGIQDFFFDECITRGKGYGIEVTVKNNESDSFGRKNQGWRYHFSYTPGWNACDDCDESVPADEVMCGLYNVINKLDAPGEWNIRLNGEVLPADHEFPFYVDKLYNANSTYEYNLAPDTTDDTTCENCLNYQAIGGVRSVAGDFDVTFSPVYHVTVGANEYSRAAAMEAIANQITVALAGNGSASVVPCTGKCCEIKLEINSCLTDIQLFDDADTTITPTQVTNPFSAVSVYQECEDCDNPAATKTYAAGLRFRAKGKLRTEKNLIPTNNVPESFVSDIEVYPTESWASATGGTRVERKQSPVEPKGQGIKWQLREKRWLLEGDGERLVHHHKGGKHQEPVERDILRRLTIDDEKSYCVLGIKNRYTGHSDETEGIVHTPSYNLNILVYDPTGSNTLATSLQSALSGYFTEGEYVDLGTVCAVTV